MKISDLEKVTKKDIIKVAQKYYGSDYVVGFRIDAQHDLPSIEKPPIDPLTIDPNKESAFMRDVEEIAYKSLTPSFLQDGKISLSMQFLQGFVLFMPSIHLTICSIWKSEWK